MIELEGTAACLGRVEGGIVPLTQANNASNKIVVINGGIEPKTAVSLRSAAGVAASGGGITSHGCNILREFKIPTLVNVNNLEAAIPGTQAILDADNEVLRIQDTK